MPDLRQSLDGERLSEMAWGLRGQNQHRLEGGPRLCQHDAIDERKGKHLADGVQVYPQRLQERLFWKAGDEDCRSRRGREKQSQWEAVPLPGRPVFSAEYF